MSAMDMQLYDYLMNNLVAISDEWLSQRVEKKGSIYSTDAGESAEILLREQNRLTNLTVASILLNDKEAFETNKRNWALVIAESRVSSDTPIYEVLDALSKVRGTYWGFVERFVLLKGNEVTQEDLLKWGISIHLAFDELNIHFSQMYDQVFNRKLSIQQSLIEALSLPIIKLNTSIGVLPLIGGIDIMRGKGFLESIPIKCVEMDISHLFIDLSGVIIIDTMVSQQFYSIIKILDLLGIHTTLTGIRPEIAQTAVQLGVDFAHIDTYSSLHLALEKSFA